ncbi:MAG: GAF domain-containing protein [Chloroflexi bacterium]|nr:MAG: GAF domain-containing protein [Chloroflexota bacterium]
MVRRLLPYAFALLSVAVIAAGLGALAWTLRIQRVETYWLIFILLIGSIAWRYGRGPAMLATLAIVLLSDYYFLGVQGHFDLPDASEMVRQVTGVLAAAAVIQFVHVSRRREVLTEKRKDLLQDVSPQILRSLDADAIVNTVSEATLTVIDYQHFRLYRWDEGSERLVLVKSVARGPAYSTIDWQNITFALGEGITGVAAESRKSLLLPDASKDPRMIYPPGTQRLEESVLSVPMVTRDRLFGVLTIARLGARTLSTEDLRLMESIAAQTALALANAEEYSEAEHTIKALSMIESLQSADTSLPEAEVDRRILNGFVDFTHADLATLRVLQNDGRYQVVATGGRKWPAGDAPTGTDLSASDVAWLADPKVAVYVADPHTDDKLPAWARRGTERAGIQASIFLPMRAGQRLIGIAGLHWRRPRWFRAEQLGRLQLLAAQAAIALETREALERERGRAEALAELERARREFMQIASHELRTPLTVIRGYASMLEDGSLGQVPPAARQALKTLLDKSTEMRAQIERMLLLARLEDGASPPQLSPIDLRSVVRDSINRVRPQVDLKQGAVDVALADEPLPVLGDSERLATAVDNLLQNAVKFSSGPPRIEVTGDRHNGRVTLVVRDHGVGIPETARRRLFEKFYRVNDPQLQNVAGTGIGLYLVRQVVEGHGGQVTVDSQPGEGASFRIELPALAEAR